MTKCIYLSIPIKFDKIASSISSKLREKGYKVLNPCEIATTDFSMDQLRLEVARKCYEMIDESDIILLFTDYYGRDCAAEMGYCIAKNKTIYTITENLVKSDFIEKDWMIYPYLKGKNLRIDDFILTMELGEQIYANGEL